MKLFVAAVAAALAITEACPGAEAGPSPGVYTLQRPLDYMQDATSAGHFAWQKELSEEFERTGLLAEKEAGKRETGDYVPTFFTTQANHDKLTASIGGPAGQARPSRNAQFAKPLYYAEYHNRR